MPQWVNQIIINLLIPTKKEWMFVYDFVLEELRRI